MMAMQSLLFIIQAISPLYFVLLATFLFSWLLLVIICLRKKDFYPIMSKPNRTRGFWLVTLLFMNPVLMILFLIFGVIKKASSPMKSGTPKLIKVVVVTIILLGFLVNIPILSHIWMTPFEIFPREITSDIPVTADATVIQCSNSLSSRNSYSSSNNTRFCGKKIIIVHSRNQPLTKQIAKYLKEYLNQLSYVDEVQIIDGWNSFKQTQQHPDFFCHVTADNIKSTSLPFRTTLEAKIILNTSKNYWINRHTSMSKYSSHTLNLNHEIELDHKSTTTGYESVKYTKAAQNIAKQLHEQLKKDFEKLIEKFGLQPELPAYVYGTYREAEIPDELRKIFSKQIASFIGMFCHNISYYEGYSNNPPKVFFEELDKLLKPTGWKKGEFSEHHSGPYIRFRKNNKKISIKPKALSNISGGIKAELPLRTEYLLAYQERFTDNEFQIVARKILEKEDLEIVSMFERFYNTKDLKAGLIERYKKESITASQKIMLAEYYKQNNQTENAVKLLGEIKTLLWLEPQNNNLASRFKQLAEKLGKKKSIDTPPTKEEMLRAGFREINANTKSFEVILKPSVPLKLFYINKKNDVEALTLAIRRSSSDGEAYKINQFKRMRHGWSSTSSDMYKNNAQLGGESIAHGLNDFSLYFNILSNKKEQSDKQTFNCKVIIKP